MRQRFAFLFPLWHRLLWAGAVFAFVVVLARDTARAAPINPSIVTTETLGAISRTDGWCVGATVAAADAWASAPARITAAIKGSARFVTVVHADDTDATIDVCAKLGPAGSSDGLTCANDTGTSGKMSNAGESIAWVLDRALFASSAPPPIWVRSAAGTVDVCIDIGW